MGPETQNLGLGLHSTLALPLTGGLIAYVLLTVWDSVSSTWQLRMLEQKRPEISRGLRRKRPPSPRKGRDSTGWSPGRWRARRVERECARLCVVFVQKCRRVLSY